MELNTNNIPMPKSKDMPRVTVNLTGVNKKKNNNVLTTKTLKRPDEMYIQRKSMQTAYQALFTALLRLPDKNVQERVLDAINGEMTTYTTTATQTDLTMLENMESVTTTITAAATTTIPSTTSPSFLSTAIETTTTAASKILNDKKQKKRKRRILLPQVSKESHALRALHNCLPKMNNNNNGKTKVTTNPHPIKSKKDELSNCEKKNSNKRIRLDSISYLLPENYMDINYNDYLNMELFEETPNEKETLLKEMIKEHIVAPILLDNGLLPIHETILDNHLIRLKRQIYIWQEIRRIDLNELLTSEQEDCLQLAVASNCIPAIIELLLLKGLNVNSLDNHGNTVIHLAIIHDNEVMSLHHLLRRIDMKQLLQLNDDGYTPLHLAIKYERFILAEYILNTLDKIYMNKIYYKRYTNANTNNNNSINMDKDIKIHDESEFIKYYKEICLNMDICIDQGKNATSVLKNCNIKMELLNRRDMCTGGTALLLAIQNKLESFIYLLLAHQCDPRIENFSGQNAKNYYNEFGRSMGLNLDIDNAMEKTIKLLEIIN